MEHEHTHTHTHLLLRKSFQGAFLGLIGRAAEDVDIDQLYLPRGLGGVGLQRL